LAYILIQRSRSLNKQKREFDRKQLKKVAI
jgi:hypothetical protein